MRGVEVDEQELLAQLADAAFTRPVGVQIDGRVGQFVEPFGAGDWLQCRPLPGGIGVIDVW